MVQRSHLKYITVGHSRCVTSQSIVNPLRNGCNTVMNKQASSTYVLPTYVCTYVCTYIHIIICTYICHISKSMHSHNYVWHTKDIYAYVLWWHYYVNGTYGSTFSPIFHCFDLKACRSKVHTTYLSNNVCSYLMQALNCRTLQYVTSNTYVCTYIQV